MIMAMRHKRPRLEAAAAPAALPDVLQFMQVLWAVVHGLQSTSKRMAAAFGVTGPQRLVVRVVGLVPGMSAGELAAVLHVHPSTLTGVLQRLVAQRWLLRVEDPRDRRRAVLRLTARGARVNAVEEGTVEAAVAQALAAVSDRDRATATRVLERLAASLQAVDAGAPSRRRRRLIPGSPATTARRR
jgi:MarR family transcriptional regulator, organic hydroperoxide resistance regulator